MSVRGVIADEALATRRRPPTTPIPRFTADQR